MVKKILIVLAGLVLILQFFRGSAPEVTDVNPDDLLATADISPEVTDILRAACYDCHSNETRYPWYSYVTPLSWFIFDHVRHGRDELNFSEWASMPQRRQKRKLKELIEEVEEGEMPLKSYTPLHSEARLSDEQKALLIEWAETYGQ